MKQTTKGMLDRIACEDSRCPQAALLFLFVLDRIRFEGAKVMETMTHSQMRSEKMSQPLSPPAWRQGIFSRGVRVQWSSRDLMPKAFVPMRFRARMDQLLKRQGCWQRSAKPQRPLGPLLS
ncbi:unnamed protein product [Durusdinium trenchii]|uniref:Uncharacterized protein n=1 Tax=Durusdinium trenchii TaxID=1381693 RepID=A0ABP0T293_9DINO